MMTYLMRAPFVRYGALIFAVSVAALFLFPGGPSKLLSSGGFLPHATCYLQNPQLIKLHVATDLLIGLSYVSISLTLAYLVWRASKDIPFHWMFLAFGIFIISCGFTHFMEVWTVWQSVYWLSGYVKAITAAASVATALALFPLTPKIFKLIKAVKETEQSRLAMEKAHAALEESHRELARQKKELEVANRELEMFTYSIAHDLKAPLRSMRSFAELLNMEYSAKLDATGQHYGARIVGASDKMGRMLDDLLAYSTVSRSEIKPVPIHLKSAATEVLGNFTDEIDQKRAEVTLDLENVTIMADQTLLNQTLSNLISNGLKYVSPGASPKLHVTAKRQESTIRISVQDNGIGIDPRYRHKIFRLFERLSPEYPGTGLGLAIVHRAVEKMHGNIGFNSEVGKGTNFWFELPLAPLT
ncbi:MAG: sensor histidine kinase [Verrucomicrobiales bacterium]